MAYRSLAAGPSHKSGLLKGRCPRDARPDKPSPRVYAKLTARERDVMRLVVSGMLTKQIASKLALSEVTATVHRGHVMRKMHANSPAELGRIAEKLKLPTTT